MAEETIKITAAEDDGQPQEQPVVVKRVGFTDILKDLAMEQDEGSGKYPVR